MSRRCRESSIEDPSGLGSHIFAGHGRARDLMRMNYCGFSAVDAPISVVPGGKLVGGAEAGHVDGSRTVRRLMGRVLETARACRLFMESARGQVTPSTTLRVVPLRRVPQGRIGDSAAAYPPLPRKGAQKDARLSTGYDGGEGKSTILRKVASTATRARGRIQSGGRRAASARCIIRRHRSLVGPPIIRK